MSRSTEILLYVDPADERHVEDLSFWIRNEAPRTDDRTDEPAGYLLPLAGEVGSEAWGGRKVPTVTLWAGVANHLDLEGFRDRVAQVSWDYPDCVQLLARDDGDPWFRLYMIRGGQIRQYCPVPPVQEQDRRW